MPMLYQSQFASLISLGLESLSANARLCSIAATFAQLQITRQKTYTSNVMDETRSNRIREHQTYHRAMKKWRLEVHGRIEEWRAEIRGKQQAEIDARRLMRSDGGKLMNEGENLGCQSRPELTPEQRREQELKEDLRKAQLDLDLANLKLIRARRSKLITAKREAMEEMKRRLLLESSKRWIGSSEELKERINTALDSPQPFGFITNLQTTPNL